MTPPRPPRPPGPVPGSAPGPVPLAPRPADAVARHLARARRTELSAPGRLRARPDAARIARRARMVRLSKWALPVVAVVLLGSLALWPEISRTMRLGRSALRQDEAVEAVTGVMVAPRYHGMDGHDRPYLVSAALARQVGPDRVDLTRPKADIVGSGGMWMMATADRGVYAPHGQVLDLDGHVTLYRADGAILTAPVATVDLKRSVESAPDWVHMEGPFGELDAQRAFLASGDGVLQFGGPSRLVLRQSGHEGGRGSGSGQP